LNYQEAINYISSNRRASIKLGLTRTQAMLGHLGNPQNKIPAILVGGTNGKGSVVATIAYILSSAGLRVGSMPKPHLVSYTERIQINNKPISEYEFASAINDIVPAVEQVEASIGSPTEFELLTVAGFNYLHKHADVLVCEVGMGGRLDSTNVLPAEVTVITNVSLEHERTLGHTIEEIAREKAGIIKPAGTVITAATGTALKTIKLKAASVGAKCVVLGQHVLVECKNFTLNGFEMDIKSSGWSHFGLRPHFVGQHQCANVGLAVTACHEFARRIGYMIPEESFAAGVNKAYWPGRMQVIKRNPMYILDGAHNPAGVMALVNTLRALAIPSPAVGIFSAMSDKNIPKMLEIAERLKLDKLIFTRVDVPRCEDPFFMARSYNREFMVEENLQTALDIADKMATLHGTVIVFGSLYLVGKVFEIWNINPFEINEEVG